MEGLVIISIGGNQGDWKSIFKSTHVELTKLGDLVKLSSIYKTEPWGVKEQPWFKNQIVGLKTTIRPRQLLSSLLEIETKHGRNREQETRWGERCLDLDILLYENEILNRSELILPHPRMHNRRFVLEPLVEIYPELIHPVLNRTMKELLSECSDKTQAIKMEYAI